VLFKNIFMELTETLLLIFALSNDLFVNLSSHLNINNLLFGDSNLPDCENESNFLEKKRKENTCKMVRTCTLIIHTFV
jgi:hypothetical protein